MHTTIAIICAGLTCAMTFGYAPTAHGSSLGENAPSIADGGVCNYSRIKLNSGSHISVRQHPTSKSKSSGIMHSKETFYSCDESKGWYQIYFGGFCSRAGKDGKPIAELKSCKSGWIKKSYVDIVSG